MSRQINSLSFKTLIGTKSIAVKTMSISINDGGTVAMENGRPNGELEGEVSATVEMVLTTPNMKLLNAEAKKAGSWKNLPPFDVVADANEGDATLNVEVFGLKVKLSELLNIDKSSSDQTTHTLPCDVTGKEFINIDGVPYLDPEDIEDLR